MITMVRRHSSSTGRLAAVVILAILVATLLTSTALAAPPGSQTSSAPDRVLVAFKPGTPGNDAAAAHAAAGGRMVGHIPGIGVHVMAVPNGKTPQGLINAYLKNPNVDYAEVDGTAQASLAPNDPIYWRQWAHPYVNTPGAWDITTGASGVTVAVVDTGIDLTHPDLAGRLVQGKDFVNNDLDPSDDNGHGTRVAGIAAATGNNGAGVAGMDWNARIMPIKALDATGYGSWSVISQAIIYAADNGAEVINMSLGGSASLTLQSAIRYAYGKGCVLVAASGNEGRSIASYPAGYPEVIAVGSVYRDVISTFSNYGSHLDVVAPGETIDTLALGGTYGRITGTSAATPFVAGLAALVCAAAPNLTPVAVMDAITSTARDLGASGFDPYYGWGHIDAAAALAAVGATKAPTEPAPSEPAPTEPPADVIAPLIALTSPLDGSMVSGIVTIAANASDAGGIARVQFYANGTLIGSALNYPYQMSWNAKKLSGTYKLVAVAYDTAGNRAESSVVTVTIGTIVKTLPAKK